MIKTAADFLLALEALVEDHVALELKVRNLDCDGRAAYLIDGLEDGRHAAACNEFDELVLVELVADVDLAHHGESVLAHHMRADVNIAPPATATRANAVVHRTACAIRTGPVQRLRPRSLLSHTRHPAPAALSANGVAPRMMRTAAVRLSAVPRALAVSISALQIAAAPPGCSRCSISWSSNTL